MWPTTQEVLSSQEKHRDTDNSDKLQTVSHGLLANNDGAIWIPSADSPLQLRICIIAHCGPAGHRRIAATYSAIKKRFFWKGMRSDVSVFCNTCLHCKLTVNGQRIPRPMGHALHATKPNEILHFDFLYLHPAEEGTESYCLILKDDMSSYVKLYPCHGATATEAAETLLDWFSTFGTVHQWISDQGPHFRNQLISKLNRQLRAHHHFTTPYCPQANGTVEHACQEVLRACRVLLSEFRLQMKKWPSVMHIAQTILNHSTRPSLGNVAPITPFLGLPVDHPLDTILAPPDAEVRSMDFIKIQRLLSIKSLLTSVDSLHKQVSATRSRTRQKSINTHNQRTNVQPVNFDIGEFVLVADVQSSVGSKLKVQWKGPFRVVRTPSPFISTVQDLVSGVERDVHNTRLNFYSDANLNVTEELLATVEHNEPHFETITKMLGLKYNSDKNQYEVKCKWRNFSHEEPTWEPIQNLYEDVKDMLNSYLENHTDQDLVAAARASLS